MKDKIMDVAMKLFAERGIRAVTMDDIAQHLCISKRTLYEIYDDKEALLFAGMRTYREQHHARLKKVHDEGGSVMDVILKLYEISLEESSNVNPQFYADIEKYPKLLEALHQERQDKRQFFMEFMKRGMDEGYFLKDINYDLIGHLFEALENYMMKTHLYEAYSFKEIYVNMLLVSLRGFCTVKGIKVLDDTVMGGR
ncbi:MAG: TetR/AcrR family transcriptional regulator [Prevotella sp.]|nr:TetR/AcrR family transcriptional regulator [Prevotella sp.]